MKKSILILLRNAVLASILLPATDAYAGFRVGRPSADVRQQALMSLQDAGPIEDYPLQSTTGEEPFTVDFSELGVENPTNAYVLLVNEETGNAVELSVGGVSGDSVSISPLILSELEMHYLGTSPEYHCLVMNPSESGDDAVLSLIRLSSAHSSTELPNFYYRNEVGDIQLTEPQERRLVFVTRGYPQITMRDPDDEDQQAICDAMTEKYSYNILSYELPDGHVVTYSDTDGIAPKLKGASGEIEHIVNEPQENLHGDLFATSANRIRFDCDLSIPDNSVSKASVQPAIQKGFQIWENALAGSIPIKVSIELFGFSAAYNDSRMQDVLGSSSQPPMVFDTENHLTFTESLGQQLAGNNFSQGYDIILKFNTDFPFYFGTDGNCPATKVDFVTVLLHELSHGLGFMSSLEYYGSGDFTYYDDDYWYPMLFDWNLTYGGASICSLTSAARKTAIRSGALFFNGEKTKVANGGNPIKMYAPGTYSPGSSVSHWDTSVTFQTFMKYAYGGYALHMIGTRKLGLMQDIGWELANQTISVPSAPTGLTASQGTYAGKVHLSWSAASGATSYTVYRSTSANGTYSSIRTGLSSSSYDDSSVSGTTRYYYKVAGVNSAGTGALSSYALGYAKLEDRTLSRIEITGAATLPQNAYADYTCTAYYSDGTSSDVSSSTTWTVPYGSIYVTQSGRRLTSLWVAESKTATFRAQYGGKTAEFTVTILPQSSVPENDAFSSPEIIAGVSGRKTGGNAGATMEAGERKPQARDKSTGSVWFKWTAPSSGTATFDTVGSSFDTVLGIYTGSVMSSLSEIGSNDDIETGNTMSRVVFRAVSGTTYRIAIYGYNGANGSYKLNWALESASGPSNDPFSAAVTVLGSSGSKTGTNTAASMETSERIPQAQSLSTGSVWYKWTAPSSGTVSFDTIGSGFDTVLGVYTGSSVSSISEVGSDDDGGGNRTSKVTFSAVSGTTYRIAVYGYSGASGSFNLKWNLSASPTTIAPVYRFYSKNYKGHFFTVSEEEMWTIRNTNRNWSFEGTAYMAFTNQVNGTVPLYRFYSKGYRGHFFTIDADEAEVVKKNRNWKYEGVAYYVYPQEVDGSVPVFRFWSNSYRHHFYTTDAEEKDVLIATNPNWAYEGVAFYALAAETVESGVKSLKKSVLSAAVAVAGEETRSEGRIPGNGSSVAAESEASLRTATRADASSVGATAGDEGLADAAPWTLWTRDRTPIKRDGATELDAVVVESRQDAPDAAELRSVESAEGDALLAETPPVELSLRLSGAPATRNATLWSASDGTVSEDDFDGTLDFDLPATGVWHWLRVADDSGNESISVWLRATAD